MQTSLRTVRKPTSHFGESRMPKGYEPPSDRSGFPRWMRDLPGELSRAFRNPGQALEGAGRGTIVHPALIVGGGLVGAWLIYKWVT